MIITIDECSSTNDEAWKLFQSSKWTGTATAIRAHRQTKGRGRQGRVWNSGVGDNLYVSVLATAPRQLVGWVPLAAGAAAMAAISDVCVQIGIAPKTLDLLRLKWPNDLYWDDGKLGGILCESRFSGERCLAVVIGLGLNIIDAPKLAEMKTAALVPQLGLGSVGMTPMAFLDSFLEAWMARLVTSLQSLDAGTSHEICREWNHWAKFDRYSRFHMHGPDGRIHELRAIELEANGRLKTELIDSSVEAGSAVKIVSLDQADSFS